MTIIGFTMWKTLGLYRLSYSAGLLQASVVQILVRNGESSYKRSTAISSYIPNTIFCRLSAILVLLSSNYHSCMNWDRISVLLVFNTITMAMDIISVAGGEQVSPYPSSTSPSLTIILENCFTKCIHLYSVGVGLPWLPGNRFSRWYTPRISAIILCHIILDLHSVYPMANNPESTPTNVTTVLFANVESNIGATLDDSWATGRERGEDRITYSDNPISVGLLEIQECQQSDDEKLEVTGVHILA